jgi:hypothetical protein
MSELDVKKMEVAKILFGTYMTTNPEKACEHLAIKVSELNILVGKLENKQ